MAEVIQRFELTEEHLKLLEHSQIQWNGYEGGGFSQDTLEPYGYKEGVDVRHKALTGEEVHWDKIPEETSLRYGELHHQGDTALQIVLQTRSFIPGIYERPYGGKWHLVQVTDCRSMDCTGQSDVHDHDPICSYMKELQGDDTAEGGTK